MQIAGNVFIYKLIKNLKKKKEFSKDFLSSLFSSQSLRYTKK